MTQNDPIPGRSGEEKGFWTVARRLWLGIILGAILVVVELVFGFISGSLSLKSDAAHNTADILASALSLFGVYMVRKRPTDRRTFGYGRVGILTALVNASALVLVAIYLFLESVRKIQEVQVVDGLAVSIVSFIALIINAGVAAALFHERDDLNIRSAFLHLAMDAIVSLGVIVAGVVILITDWYYIDPIIAMAISITILWSAWMILREATDILLESVPRHLDIDKIRDAILSVDGVEGVHHMHVWELGSGVYALSAHVDVGALHLTDCAPIVRRISTLLEKEFEITHPTIQLEACRDCEAPECGRTTPP